MPDLSREGTHAFDQKHADEVVPLAGFVDGDSREPREQDLVDRLVIQDLIRWKDQTVFNRRHDFLGLLVV